jgi:hypothetical protein
MRWFDDCRSAMSFDVGGGIPAMKVMQPTQQQSAQILLLVSSVEGAVRPVASVWQIMRPGCIAVSAAAARAAPTLANRLDNAIA